MKKIEYLKLLRSRKFLVALLLGFSSGIPLGLITTSLQAYLADFNVDVKTIGLFSLVGLPYAWKFLWSPLLDRFYVPFLGRRRGWILVFQVLLALFIFFMGQISPASNPWGLAICAFCISFWSASQDIVCDAFRIDTFSEDERPLGLGIFVGGYRVALLLSGAVALSLADQIPWSSVFGLVALMIGIGAIGTFIAQEPVTSLRPTSTLGAFIEPIQDFFSRVGAFEILLFALLSRLDSILATSFTTKFFLDVGYTKTEIAALIKGLGMISTISGGLIGGLLLPKLGLFRSLLIFGILQGATNILYAWSGAMGVYYPALAVAITADNLVSGMGSTAYGAFLMAMCNPKYTATQFALFSSLLGITRSIGGAASGYIASGLGVEQNISAWQQYYLVTALSAIPGILMLYRFKKWKLNS